MSDTREKLIKMLMRFGCDEKCDSCEFHEKDIFACLRKDAGIKADHLIANGVTVQKWVPAKDPPKESGEYIVMIHGAANSTTLMYHAGEKSWFEVTMEDGEELYTYYPVDYWMHLPIPPREGE